MEPPSESPMIAASLLPASSMTARMSSIRSSSVAASVGRSDIPVPLLSNRISRQNELQSSIARADSRLSQDRSRCEIVPGAQTMSIGPLPVTWYAMRTVPLLAYFVSGRFKNCQVGVVRIQWLDILVNSNTPPFIWKRPPARGRSASTISRWPWRSCLLMVITLVRFGV